MKTEIQPYLTFNGDCEDAFNFYKYVFGSEFSYIGRFSDMPPQEGMPVLPPQYANRIMHIALPISGDFVLFGSDTIEEWGTKLVVGNNITLSLKPETKEEANRLFNALSEGGIISMPMGDTFWGAYFGMFTDRFGINWMINIENN